MKRVAHSGELTQIVPFEMVDAALAETGRMPKWVTSGPRASLAASTTTVSCSSGRGDEPPSVTPAAAAATGDGAASQDS